MVRLPDKSRAKRSRYEGMLSSAATIAYFADNPNVNPNGYETAEEFLESLSNDDPKLIRELWGTEIGAGRWSAIQWCYEQSRPETEF